MSNSNARRPRVAAGTALRMAAASVVRSVRFVGFWLSVALPLLYLPLLVGGLTAANAVTFVVLFGLNVLALIAGHGYAR